MAGASEGGRAARGWAPLRRGLSKVFRLQPGGANWPRAVAFLDVALVPLLVFWAIGYEQYLFSAVFGLLFTALADPGGGFRRRAALASVFALAGAGTTALGFGVGTETWGWLVLAASAFTLVAGLAVAFGVRRFVDALLLNVWLVIALGLAFTLHHHGRIVSHTWAQVLAWAGGAALWSVLTFAEWLLRRRADRPRPFAELPGGTSRRELTRPLVMFAVIRALVIAGTTALAFGLDLSHGIWIPIAAIVAMKPSLEQATLMSAQRLAGAVIGALAASLLLLVPPAVHGLRLLAVTRGLEVVALVLLVHAVGVRFMNYALYTAAVAAGVLILIDLPQPTDYAGEGYRVLWTLCGAGTGLLVMFLASLLAPPASPPPAPPQSR